ncbi:MAG: hypothetical protein QXE52_08310 [Candidatus Caldarchaeum sp.]
MRLFEPPKKPRKRVIAISVLDVVLLATLAIAFTLLDIVFRNYLEPVDLAFIRYLMIASWVVVFIFELALAYLRQA